MPLAPRQLIEARLHVGSKMLARLVALLQEAQGLADHFAGGLVQAALNLVVSARHPMVTVFFGDNHPGNPLRYGHVLA